MPLRLKHKQAFDLLDDWSSAYLEGVGNVSVKFSSREHMGAGSSKHNMDGSYQIKVGIAPLSNSFFVRNNIMADSDFVRIGVTMFHELAHYSQNADSDTSKEILISDLSKYRNRQYYKDNWHIMPHEVDAEYTGIMSMWSHLKNISPDIADRLMLDRLANRTESSKSKYVFQRPEDGFQSKEQADSLFEDAYNNSLAAKRVLSGQFLRSSDEIAQMLTDGDGIIRMDYYPFYYQMQKAETGQEMDLKMASLVSYIHPELQAMYPSLDFKELEPEVVFGIPVPEIREEILWRIIPSGDGLFSDTVEQDNIQDFTEAVAAIPVNGMGLEQ